MIGKVFSFIGGLFAGLFPRNNHGRFNHNKSNGNN